MLMPPRGYVALPRRRVVERTFSWISEQTDEQGLREAVHQRRSVHLRDHDSADGEAVGSWLRISRQSLQALKQIRERSLPTSLRFARGL